MTMRRIFLLTALILQKGTEGTETGSRFLTAKDAKYTKRECQ